MPSRNHSSNLCIRSTGFLRPRALAGLAVAGAGERSADARAGRALQGPRSARHERLACVGRVQNRPVTVQGPPKRQGLRPDCLFAERLPECQPSTSNEADGRIVPRRPVSTLCAAFADGARNLAANLSGDQLAGNRGDLLVEGGTMQADPLAFLAVRGHDSVPTVLAKLHRASRCRGPGCSAATRWRGY